MVKDLRVRKDPHRREEAASAREAALQDEIARVRQQLGQALGELNAYKARRPKRPKWWVWLFGEAADGPAVVAVDEEGGTARSPGEPLALLAHMGETLDGVRAVLTLLVEEVRQTKALRTRIEHLEVEKAELRRRIGTPLLWMLLGAVITGVIAAGIAVSLISLGV